MVMELVWPPVRDLGLADADAEEQVVVEVVEEERVYVLCCVRVTKVKNVEAFVDAVVGNQELLRKNGMSVYMCGPVAKEEEAYAERLFDAVEEAFPDGVVVRGGVDTEELVRVMRKTVLNFHPSLYEPWGMSVAEAGVCGAVSLVHEQGVGVVEDLWEGGEGMGGRGGVLRMDMEGKGVVDGLRRVLEEEGRDGLVEEGRKAQAVVRERGVVRDPPLDQEEGWVLENVVGRVMQAWQ